MEFKAKGKFIRVSHRKAKIIADQIRGLGIESAINILKFCPKVAGKIVLKILNSAVANAEEREDFKNVDKLVVKNVFVDQGPTMKRIQPRAMGRAYRIRKRSSHITIILSDEI